MKTFIVYNLKCAVVATLISLAFASQAFAVLRPLFPAKPAPPFNGELIIIGNDLLLGLQKDAPSITRVRHHSQCLEAVRWPPRSSREPGFYFSMQAGRQRFRLAVLRGEKRLKKIVSAALTLSRDHPARLSRRLVPP